MLSRFLRSTAMALALAVVAPSMRAPNIFVYKSAQADPADQTHIPDWIKSSCCGPQDVHRLTPAQVHHTDDYYTVDGYGSRIPDSQVEPSQDGNYWIFYRDDGGGSQSGVYCFFIPMAF